MFKTLLIDYGARVVIGETAEVRNDVLMYRGVALEGNRIRWEMVSGFSKEGKYEI